MTDVFSAALAHATRTVVARTRGELRVAAPADAANRPSGTIAHTFCCHQDVALCGLEITGTPAATEDEQDCVVCADLTLNGGGCPLCSNDATA
ncbi:hypothetical protein GTY65_24390 [Streptomyces sp. SID8379]|uniref:hypothetical protein n=1 Tax=unclassified Streptomyces TaxID=2593676 RepID=UPI001319C148|nr:MULTISPECIES: hypothetical protein [unclassified Streptomyces]MYW67182.1 hypothetical protein [Streptomyces sp. SID8379]